MRGEEALAVVGSDLIFSKGSREEHPIAGSQGVLSSQQSIDKVSAVGGILCAHHCRK